MVLVGVKVGVMVRVGVKVGVLVRVGVLVAVLVRVGVLVAVRVGVWVLVGVAVGVRVPVAVFDGVAVRDGVHVGARYGSQPSIRDRMVWSSTLWRRRRRGRRHAFWNEPEQRAPRQRHHRRWRGHSDV